MVDIAQLAVKVDTTDLKRGGAELDNLAKKGDRAEKEIKQLGAAAKTSGGNVRQLGTAAGQASSRMGAMRGQVQNVAFQVGDMATQIGAGTSAAQALGQQLPQLLGGFGVLGAVAGAAVAVLVPLAASFIDLGDNIEDVLDDVDEFIDKLQSARKIATQSADDLAAAYGLSSSRAKELLEINQRIVEVNALDELAKAGASISESMDFSVVESFLSGFNNEAGKLAHQFGVTREEALSLVRAFRDIERADGAQATADALRSARENLTAVAGSYSEMDGSLRAVYDSLIRAERAALELSAASLSAAGASEAQEASAGRLLDEMNREASLKQLIITYGEKSRQVTEARVEAERAAFEETLATMQVSEALKDELREAWDNANGIAITDMAGNISSAAQEAARLASNLGIALTAAYSLANMQSSKVYSGRGGDPRGYMEGGSKSDYESSLDYKPVSALIKSLSKKSGGGRRGGGRSKVDKEQLKLEREAAKVFADTRTEAEKYSIELEKLNNLKAKGAIDADTYTRALDNISQKYLNIGGAAEFWQDQMKSLQDGIVDAIVEGDNLAEVFGNLAKEIAKAAFQAALFNQGPFAQQGGGGGLLGGLFNGMFGGLSKLASFDGGGYTGDGSRVGGVDGKGGKLSILHPNETVLDHTKGGGMSASPVNNIIVYDMREVGNYMSTPEGESKIVEVMRRNGWQAA